MSASRSKGNQGRHFSRNTDQEVSRDSPNDAETAPSLLDDLLSHSPAASEIQGIVIGAICGWDKDGAPLVDFPGNPRKVPLPARSTLVLDKLAMSRQVALLFENNNSAHPVVIGLIQSPTADLSVTVDEKEVVLEARERIELRCGKAKIVLTSDGRILVKGTDVMSRSEGPNRLKGASIQIN